MKSHWFDAMCDATRQITPKMQAGLVDPDALAKLRDEQQELDVEIAAMRRDDALTELADVCYYASKAVLNNLLARDDATVIINSAAYVCGVVRPETVLAIMQAKYALRSTGVKDKDAERVACVAVYHSAHEQPRRYVEIGLYDGGTYIVPESDLHTLVDEIMAGDVGAQWTVTLIEMTDAAFTALPEFQGH